MTVKAPVAAGRTTYRSCFLLLRVFSLSSYRNALSFLETVTPPGLVTTHLTSYHSDIVRCRGGV